MRKLGFLLLLGGASAYEYVPGGNLPEGSQWLPRKSIQWPIPASGFVERDNTVRLCLSESLNYDLVGYEPTAPNEDVAHDVLRTAIEELTAELQRADGRQSSCGQLITTITINISGGTAGTTDLGRNVNERYALSVTNSAATIMAPSVFGARHAITTLSNMLEVYNPDPPTAGHYAHTIPQGTQWYYILPYAPFTITDEPRLGHRGVMIDTARHYQEWEDMYKVVDGLSRSKMNVLHWHATDDQSFPLVLDQSKDIIHGPECSREEPYKACRGAYTPYMTYHQVDIEKFIDYAYLHGVRIMIEIDQPSHARSWANLDHSLRECADLEHQVEGYCVQPICGPLALNDNYNAVRELADLIIADWIRLGSKTHETLHLGMDEIGSSCWGDALRDELSAKWLKDSVEAIYAAGMQLGELEDREILVWQDGLDYHTHNVSVPVEASKVMAHVWDNPSEAANFLEEGRDIVWSNYAAYYLDCGRGNTAIPTFNSWCDPYKTWWHIYRETPDYSIPYDSTIQGVGKILGGEVPLWAEQTDSSNLHTLLWPRTAALGGSLWEKRASAMRDPANVEEAAIVLRAQHELASLSNRNAQVLGLRHTPMFVQWCIYEDEKFCDKFTDSFYTPTEGGDGDGSTEESTDSFYTPTEGGDGSSSASAMLSASAIGLAIAALAM